MTRLRGNGRRLRHVSALSLAVLRRNLNIDIRDAILMIWHRRGHSCNPVTVVAAVVLPLALQIGTGLDTPVRAGLVQAPGPKGDATAAVLHGLRIWFDNLVRIITNVRVRIYG